MCANVGADDISRFIVATQLPAASGDTSTSTQLLPTTTLTQLFTASTATMKFANASVLALLAPAVGARFVEEDETSHVQLHPEGQSAELFQIELSPGETRWVTEDQKWELRRVSSSRRQTCASRATSESLTTACTERPALL